VLQLVSVAAPAVAGASAALRQRIAEVWEMQDRREVTRRMEKLRVRDEEMRKLRRDCIHVEALRRAKREHDAAAGTTPVTAAVSVALGGPKPKAKAT
jgi:hypothetical protein